MTSKLRTTTSLLALTALLIGCGSDSDDAVDTTIATVPVTTDPETTGPGTAPDVVAPAIVTFEVAGDEQFKVELVSQELVDHALQLLDGANISAIPLGTVVRDDPGVNEPWSWHLDPATFEFAFATTEVCDGIPSFVEDETVTSDQYCPWSAKVIAVDHV